MEYTFVLMNKGTDNQHWCLKVTNINTFADYIEKIDNRIMTNGFNDYIFNNHPGNLGYLIGGLVDKYKIRPLDAAQYIQVQKIHDIIDLIEQGYEIYINKNGGYCFGHNDYTDWCHKKEMIFPDFKIDQIKIESFPGGKHFYAYIDNMPVRDGDTIKWDTYKEAYDYAATLVKNADY